MPSFFTASKVLWFIACPSNLAVLLALLALLLFRWRRLSFTLLGVAVLVLAGLGLSPAANALIAPLEDRFPLFRDDGRPIDGIIVLGGSEVTDVGLARGVPAFDDAGERMMAFADLARRYPHARLAFAGGSSALLREGGGAESRLVRQSLPVLGIDPARVTFEDRSRNTQENAQFAKALLNPQPGARWLLVTSAWHMPRAVGCFRAAGFPVEAYPVDFRSPGPHGDGMLIRNRASENLSTADTAVREWVGLVTYYLTGKIPSLFPAPQAAG